MAIYGHSDLWFNYFAIRQQPWDGDKAALRYLQAHDPAYLSRYQAFIDATERDEKIARYTLAARHATEPLGGLWSENETTVNILEPAWTWPELIK